MARGFDGIKHDKEIKRAERKQAKAERLARRRAEKLHGIEIDSLPEQWKGIARTLANGSKKSHNAKRASTGAIILVTK